MQWLLLSALVLLSGCAEPTHDSLRFGLSSAPITFDPRLATDASSDRINRLIYRPLVDFDQAMMPVPALARWQQHSPLHYRFTLDGSRQAFHNGSRVEAEDVVATYLSVLDPGSQSSARSSLMMIDRIVAVDSDTVDFYLNRADPLFPAYLVLGIMPSELIASGHGFSKQPVGNGPYRMISWPNEGQLVLERIADRQRLEFLHIADPTVRALKLMRGEIDMLQNDLPPELVGYLAKQDLQVLRRQGSNFSYLGFNLADPVTGNLKLRQAIAYAIDRESIIRQVFGGAARPATAIFPPEHWAGNTALEQYRFDPKRAKQLLTEAGYGPQRPPHIIYKTSSDPFRIRLATILQSQLKQQGIDVELRSYDWGTFYGDIKEGRFQMFSLAWIGIRTPDIFRYAYHSASIPPVGANRGRYHNSHVDSLIDQAEKLKGYDELASAYRDMEAIIHADLPYVPLWYEDHVFISRQQIKSYRISPDGSYDGLITIKRS